MTYSVIVGQHASLLERKAAQLFVERSRARSGLEIAVLEEMSGWSAPGSASDRFGGDGGKPGVSETSRIIIGTPESSVLIRQACDDGELDIPADLGKEGYVIQGGGEQPLYVAAQSEHGVLYGIGKLLRLIGYNAGKLSIPALELVSRPAKSVRGIYFATHFGNWYCHAELEDVRAYLEDLALWGVNELLVWFDVSRIPSLEAGKPLLERLATFEAFAGEVGMKVGRIAIANEGFQGQTGSGRPMLSKNCFDETDYHPLRARDRIFGGFDTDICPSQPEGRAIILHNKEITFSSMPPLDSYWLWPYDQGGCNCPQCTPWPKTFMELNREIAAMAGKMLPDMTVNVSAWWFEGHQPGEDDAFFKFLDEEDKREDSWFKYIFAGAVEAKRWRADGRVVPERHPVVLFPEISMFDSCPWGGKGGNQAPRKFAAEYAELRDSIEGAFPYSEGIYEDMNKVIWAQMMWHSEEAIEQIVAEYCRFYFGEAVGKRAEQLVFQMEDIVTGAQSAVVPAIRLDALAGELEEQMEQWARNSWRWKMVRFRSRIQACLDRLMELDTADASAGQGAGDGLRASEQRELLEQFKTAYDYMQKELHLHRPGESLETWVYTSSDMALKIFAGKVDVINLTLEQHSVGES